MFIGKAIGQLLKEGWDQIPETMFGVGCGSVGKLL